MLRRLTQGLLAPMQTMKLTLYDDYTYQYIISILHGAKILMLSTEERDGCAVIIIYNKDYDGLVNALEDAGFVF